MLNEQYSTKDTHGRGGIVKQAKGTKTELGGRRVMMEGEREFGEGEESFHMQLQRERGRRQRVDRTADICKQFLCSFQ